MTRFNEIVAMDLKTFHSGYVLHMVDHATRYSQSCFIKNKRKEIVVRGVLKHWISLFGSLDQLLLDNGGEFINDEFMELAEKFNITIKITAAESPYPNGSVENTMEYLEIWFRKLCMTPTVTWIWQFIGVYHHIMLFPMFMGLVQINSFLIQSWSTVCSWW